MKDLNIQLKEEQEELNNYKELMTKPEGTIFWVVNYKSQNLVKNNFLQVDGNYLNYFEYFEINRNLIKTNINKPYFTVLNYNDDIFKIFFNEIEAKENFYNFLIEKDMDSMKESFFLSEENLELKNKFTKILIEQKIQKYNSELESIQNKISYLQTKLNQ